MDINYINMRNNGPIGCPSCGSFRLLSLVDIESDRIWCANCKTKLALEIPEDFKREAEQLQTGVSYEDMLNDPS